MLGDQRFNDDLLLADEDQKLAAQSFPELLYALDFPELRTLFLRYDAPSTLAKGGRRRAGIVAIMLGVIALLGAASEPLLFSLPPFILPILGGLFAGLGIVSVVIGAFGVFGTRSKKEWLCGRLMTERLRQLHFQILVCYATSIMNSMGDATARAQFHITRQRILSSFELDYAGHLSGKLNDVLADNAEEEFWLLSKDAKSTVAQGRGAEEFFSAYRLLRFEHQIQYANYKLRQEGLGSAIRQVGILSQTSVVCILLVFVLHFVIALSLLTPMREWLAFAEGPWMHVFVVWTAIVALAARALEEGLQPTREVERYTRYRSLFARLLYHFDHTSVPAERLQIMREAERAVYQEMRVFLKTNHEARFVL
jgi:hypothetical protein